jgi:hypothetical protein
MQSSRQSCIGRLQNLLNWTTDILVQKVFLGTLLMPQQLRDGYCYVVPSMS